MWEIILAAGWPIWPLIFASIIALAIIGERFWSLRVEIVAPGDLLPEVQNLLNQGTIKKDVIAKIKEHPHFRFNHCSSNYWRAILVFKS